MKTPRFRPDLGPTLDRATNKNNVRILNDNNTLQPDSKAGRA